MGSGFDGVGGVGDEGQWSFKVGAIWMWEEEWVKSRLVQFGCGKKNEWKERGWEQFGEWAEEKVGSLNKLGSENSYFSSPLSSTCHENSLK